MILPNITVNLEEHCLSVNVDLEILMEEPTIVHPDNKIKGKEESRAITNINYVEYLLQDKIGIVLFPKQYKKIEATLMQLVLNEIETLDLDTLKNM